MAICPTDITSYVEEIRTFTFRGIDGITIPKSVRQEAYVLAVDIVIRSIARESYKNYNCMPPEGFYGNATIVMQDALELKIPVKFPRQRIYYGRVPEAFDQWNQLVNFEYMRAYFLAVGESLQSLGAALGAGSVPAIFCCSLPEPSWQELPLREIYFHPPIGTQYEIEVTWTRPVAFSDSCDTFYDGQSRQVDGDKDSGLPSEGMFPNIADDENNPYAGLPPETPDSEQLGFSNSKSANLDDVDPANEPEEPIPPGQKYMRVVGIVSRPGFVGGCATIRTETSHYPVLEGVSVVSIVQNSFNLGVLCPGKGEQRGWDITLTGGSPANYGYSDSAPTVTFIYSETTPADTLVFT